MICELWSKIDWSPDTNLKLYFCALVKRNFWKLIRSQKSTFLQCTLSLKLSTLWVCSWLLLISKLTIWKLRKIFQISPKNASTKFQINSSLVPSSNKVDAWPLNVWVFSDFFEVHTTTRKKWPLQPDGDTLKIIVDLLMIYMKLLENSVRMFRLFVPSSFALEYS